MKGMAQEGMSTYCCAHMRLFPKVAMSHIQGIGFICTLGIWDACRETFETHPNIVWPYSVEIPCSNTPCASHISFEIKTHGGISDEGMFVDVDVICVCTQDARSKLVSLDFSVHASSAIQARIDVWQAQEHTPASLAGPIASVMDEYYNCLRDIGKRVTLHPHDDVSYVFAGIDVWGHAHLLDDEHNEIRVAPDTAQIYVEDTAHPHA